MIGDGYLRVTVTDPRQIHAMTVRGQAAGLCFWTRQAFVADPEREIVVISLKNRAEADHAEKVLAGLTEAISVPHRIISQLPSLERNKVPNDLVDSRWGQGAHELERALLGNFNPCHPTNQLIQQYLFRLSRKRTLNVQETVEWLLNFWHLGDVGCSNAQRNPAND